MLHWFKHYCDFVGSGGFGLAVELHCEGFAIIRATPSSFTIKKGFKLIWFEANQNRLNIINSTLKIG